MAEEKPKIPESIILENSGKDNTVSFDKDDVIQEIREDSVDLVRQKMKDGKNQHQLKIGSKIFSIQTPNGNPAPLANGGNVEEEFMEQQTSDVNSSFEQTSDTDIFSFDIAKGKTDEDLDSVNEIMQDINTNLGESKVAKDVERFQQENNIFSKDNLYVSTEQREAENNSNVGNVRLQKSLGKHGPRKWPDAVDEDSNVTFEIEKLKNLGIQILMNSSGEIKAAIPNDPNRPGDVIKAQLASTVPGAARLGVKVPLNRFSAAEVAKDINPNFEKTSRFPELEQESRFSYGSTNNHLVPFHAINNTSSRAAAILLSLTLSGMLKALAAVLNPPNIGLKNPVDIVLGNQDTQLPKAELRKDFLGSYIGQSRKINDTGAGLGPISTLTSLGSKDVIARTRNDYTTAVNVGLQVFFGAPQGAVANILGAISPVGIGNNQGFNPVKQNPEYFSVLLRMLVRSTVDDVLGAVGAAAAALGADLDGRTPTQMDIDRTPGLDANPTNLLVVIENLRESKLVKFLNIIASIGDICIENVDLESGERIDSPIDSTVDNLNDTETINPAALVKKNRLSNAVWSKFEDRMSWGADTIQSMYMRPSNLIAGEKLWYANIDSKNIESVVATDKNYIDPEKQLQSGRLPTDMVRKVEQLIDSYYMPFYFHDLRTNEIIAFHAFIESISDSFDVDYNESEGYGRIGRVYSYKNTNRNISLSFRVVSTGPDDFNNMWLKINKLIMLIYPQYTKGRQLNYNNGKFIQPFSQLISNSPMIRLRVGDLIKSNFSEFDLARLFGVGTENYKLDADDVTLVDGQAVDFEALRKLRKNSDRMVAYDFDVGDRFTLSQFGADEGHRPAITYVDESGLGAALGKIAKSAAGAITGATNDRDRTSPLPINIKVTVLQKVSNGVYILNINEPSTRDSNIKVDFNNTLHALGVDPDFEYLKNKTGTSELLANIPAPQLQAATNSFANPQTGASSDSIGTPTFLGPENPIFKAFESTHGQGLAGFIKRISFDWSDAQWATDGINNRAPMWARVDVDFAPVHDIAPGLDSTGSPIGLPYNIGAILKRMKLNRAQTQNNENESDYIDKTAQAAKPSSKKTRKN